MKKFCDVVTAPTAFVLVNVVNPRPPSVACGPSTDSARNMKVIVPSRLFRAKMPWRPQKARAG